MAGQITAAFMEKFPAEPSEAAITRCCGASLEIIPSLAVFGNHSGIIRPEKQQIFSFL
jgi:hypothetical protein